MLAHADYASDVYVFAYANHQLLVVGTAEEGFRLWCRRCDCMGKRTYRSSSAASVAHYGTALEQVIERCWRAVGSAPPLCRPAEKRS